MIELNGSTIVTDAGNHYLLLTSGGVVTLRYANLDVTLGQFAGWTPIGAESRASGYEVAWKFAGAESIHGVDHRQQRQLLSNTGRRVGTARLAIARDQFPSGPQRRWCAVPSRR